MTAIKQKIDSPHWAEVANEFALDDQQKKQAGRMIAVWQPGKSKNKNHATLFHKRSFTGRE
jgi:hypothetical protein